MGRVARRGCGRRDRRAESEAQLRHCLRFKGRVDPYAKHPTFETDISLSQLDMRQLNPFLRAHAHLDVERGTFSVDAEFAAKKGKFEGYVKPFMVKLDVLQGEKENEGFVNKIWQGVADLASELLEDLVGDGQPGAQRLHTGITPRARRLGGHR